MKRLLSRDILYTEIDKARYIYIPILPALWFIIWWLSWPPISKKRNYARYVGETRETSFFERCAVFYNTRKRRRRDLVLSSVIFIPRYTRSLYTLLSLSLCGYIVTLLASLCIRFPSYTVNGDTRRRAFSCKKRETIFFFYIYYMPVFLYMSI